MEYQYYDVIVIGGGGAAIRAALAAEEENPEVSVALLTKGKLGHSGVTAIACSDRMAFHATLDQTEPLGREGWPLHAADIYEIGGEVSDRELADILAQGSAEAFEYLDGLGVPWVRRNGKIDQFITDGSDYARACYTGPKTAVHIEEALVKRLSRSKVSVLENKMAIRLLTEEQRIVGVAALDTISEQPIAIAASAVILATGGPGGAYLHNVYPASMSGDGWAMAYDAGAELVNTEFIQFMISSVKTKLLLSGSMMRAVPRIVNENDEEILFKYLPSDMSPAQIHELIFSKGYQFPVSYEHPTYIMDVAVFRERQAGHKVYIDFSRNPDGFSFAALPEEYQKRYQKEQINDLGAEARQAAPVNRLMEINPGAFDIYKERGIDILQGERVEVASSAQHFQGGVRIDEHARTTVQGLWAVGENAGGQHGANRPGGNALMDCQVFGKIAGADAANSRRVRIPEARLISLADEVFSSSEHFDKDRAAANRAKIQTLLDRYGGVVRTQKGLSVAIRELNEMKDEVDRACCAEAIPFTSETRSMWLCAQMICSAAKLRCESRGPHLLFTDETASKLTAREDVFWKRYIVIRKHRDRMEFSIEYPR